VPIEGISCWRLQLNLCFHARLFKAVIGDRFDPGLPWADGVYLDMCFSSFCAAFFGGCLNTYLGLGSELGSEGELTWRFQGWFGGKGKGKGFVSG